MTLFYSINQVFAQINVYKRIYASLAMTIFVLHLYTQNISFFSYYFICLFYSCYLIYYFYKRYNIKSRIRKKIDE